MLPKTFLAELAERSPIIIVENHLYQMTDDREQSDSKNLIKVGKCEFGLVPSLSLDELERLYRDINKKEIFEHKKKFIEDRLHREIKTNDDMEKYVSENDLLHFAIYELFPLYAENEKEVVDVIKGINVNTSSKKNIEKILEEELGSYEVTTSELENLKRELMQEQLGVKKEVTQEKDLRGKDREIKVGDLVEVYNSGNKNYLYKDGQFGKIGKICSDHYHINFNEYFDKAMYNNITVLKKDVKLKKDAEPKVFDNALVTMLQDYYQRKPMVGKFNTLNLDNKKGLSDILDDEPAFFMNGTFYKLQNKAADNEFQVVINGESFGLRQFAAIPQIDEAYKQYLDKIFRLESIEEFKDQLKEIQRIRSRNKLLERLKDKNEFEIGDIGYLRKNGLFYVYLKIPKFAMKHPNKEEYYGFDPCRVGVNLNISNGEIYGGEGVVIDAYSHPFLPRQMTPFQRICTLDKAANTAGLKRADQVAKLLDDAKNVFIHGLTNESFASHGGTDLDNSFYYGEKLDDRLKGRKLSLEEVKKGGYVITNLLFKYVDSARRRL